MSQEDNSAVRLLSYHELIVTLQGLCREKQSGVMVISSDTGGTAKLTLEQGIIFDINFAGVTGRLALSQLKKIIKGKVAFFKRAQGNAVQNIDLSTAEILQTLLNATPVTPENPSSITQAVIHEDQLFVIEAYLAALIGPIARLIYSEYKQEIQQADDLSKLSGIIEKIAQQVLLVEKQKHFKHNIRDFIARTGLKDQKSIVNVLKSSSKELKIHPATLALFISKYAVQGELNTVFLTKLAAKIEDAGDLAGTVRLFDLLRFLERTTKTGLVSVESKGKKAGFYFDQGVLINAFEGERHGAAVAVEILQWEAEHINFISMAKANVPIEIRQTVAVLFSSIHASIISKEEALKYTKTDRTATEIQSALAKEIERLQGKTTDKKEETKHEAECLELLVKAILCAESYNTYDAELLLCQVLLAQDNNYQAWFWLAKVLTNMTSIEYALKKAAYLNSKSSELADEVKKFTLARRLVKHDFVLRCPFCFMPVNEKDHECSNCLANFFIDGAFFSKIGKAKTDMMDKAIARYGQALQQHIADSDHIYSQFYLAMAYLNRQYYHEALAQLNEISKLMPENRAFLQQSLLLTKQMQSIGIIANANEQNSNHSATEIKAKILIVEDSMVTRKVIARTLTGNGYEVFEAKNADEALTDIVKRNPDLILLDIILPGDKDGYDILAVIRQTPAIAKVPVIMLTSRDSLFDKLKGKVSDANEYLTKPFQPDELLLVVKKYLK